MVRSLIIDSNALSKIAHNSILECPQLFQQHEVVLVIVGSLPPTCSQAAL